MVGRTVTGLEVFGPRTLRRHPPGPADFVARVVGRRVEAACRRGKYLWLPLSPAPSALVAGPQPRSHESEPDSCILAHLGMSGQFLAVEGGTPVEAHLGARFSSPDGGPGLRFLDHRPFGGLPLEPPDAREAPPLSVAHIALDPLDAA